MNTNPPHGAKYKVVKAKVSRRVVKLEPVEEDQERGESGDDCRTDAMLKLPLSECSDSKQSSSHEQLGASVPDAEEMELRKMRVERIAAHRKSELKAPLEKEIRAVVFGSVN